jgi:serine/threonine-protein kinase
MMIGTTVGNYRIVERLGDGGMGSVYRAVDEMLDREVAIKVLRSELARQAALIERFRQEAKALARLSHPRIATLHGLEKHGDDLLMVMEYVRGDTLEAIVERSGRIAWPRAAELCIAVLDALDHAHDMGVVHRDIKPANVMLSRSGAVKVMDFGIARVMGRSRQTQFGHSVGTPMYMSPEQLRGEEVDGRADLYAVGAVLFELVTGRMAFDADSDYRLMMMQLHEPPPAPSALVPDVPAVIDAIVLRAMQKRAEDRYPGAPAFAAALRDALATANAPAPRPVAPATRLAESARETAEHHASDHPGATTPATRLASDTPAAPLASDAAASSTRLAASESVAPATRLATPDVRIGAPSRASGRLRDWRLWSGAAAFLIAAALSARALRGRDVDPTPSAADSVKSIAATDSARRGASAASDSSHVVATQLAAATSRENAASLIINPPADNATAPASPAPDPVRADPPSDPATVRPRPSRRDSLAAPTAPPSRASAWEAGSEAASRGTAAPPPPPVVEHHRSDAEQVAAIGAALAAAADALGARDARAAESLLAGDAIRERWIALAREGRLTMRLDGAPDVRLRGSSASAEFGATVTVRSPFGGNRRSTARFVAELEPSGDEWRVTRVRAVGGVELK